MGRLTHGIMPSLFFIMLIICYTPLSTRTAALFRVLPPISGDEPFRETSYDNNHIHPTPNLVSYYYHPNLTHFHKRAVASSLRRRLVSQIDDHLNIWVHTPTNTSFVDLSEIRKWGYSTGSRFCASYFRIVDSQVYFKYPDSLSWFTTLRVNIVALYLKEVIQTWEIPMKNLRLEFSVNTCDHPKSRSDTLGAKDQGKMFLETHGGANYDGILYPDPLDLSPRYSFDFYNSFTCNGSTYNVIRAFSIRRYTEGIAKEHYKAWDERLEKAVFRGSTTNYDLFREDQNWREASRFRLQWISENTLGDILDARLVGWSHISKDSNSSALKNAIEKDGYKICQECRLTPAEIMNNYKYQMIVEGGMGDCRLCAVLLAEQVPIVQEKLFSVRQYFYEAMSELFTHLKTKNRFQDLKNVIQFLKKNDHLAKRIARNGRFTVGPLVCTHEGRMEYWALILHFLNKTLDSTDFNRIKAPSEMLVCTDDSDKNHQNKLAWRSPKWSERASYRLGTQSKNTNCSTNMYTQDTWINSKDLDYSNAIARLPIVIDNAATCRNIGAMKSDHYRILFSA